MSYPVMLGIAIGLAIDAFAVAVASSIKLRGVSKRQVFRLAFHFGLFQAFMPIIGWALGQTVTDYFSYWDHWIAFVLLGGVGIKSLYEGLKNNTNEESAVKDPTKGISLVALSVATSIDALAIGLSFAVLQIPIWQPCIIIGLVAAALTTIGMFFGERIGGRLGHRAEIIGGLVLIGIGVKIVIDHLLAG